ncbi:MAG TPA: ATP-binding protein [Bacteroidia bacterium]|nr:ATP-binding protein [Bacteroidia bacterium]
MVELSSEKILIVAIGACLGASLLIFFLVWALITYYNAMVKKQKDLVNTMIETQEKERLRIARDLHDNFGNIFTIIQLEISTLNDIHEIDKMRNSFIHLNDNIELARKHLKHNVTQLAPGNLKSVNWLNELERFQEVFENAKLKLMIEVSGKVQVYSEINQTNLHRIIQELINNTLKYAKAKVVKFFITFTDNQLILEFMDDGIGFNMDEKSNAGFGLKSLQARTDAMQGKCLCNSKIGEGTSWTFTFLHKHLL